MKLFKSKLKKNNKGMTLVEVICSVAILGLATSAVGGAMVVSAKSYQRNTIEFEVQQEVQTTTNLIGNMVVDAKTANWNPDTKTLLVSGNGLDYTIVYDESTRTLQYYQEDDTGTSEGVLAENVASFDIDDSKFATSKSIKVDLQVVKDDKVYSASYNTTARNGEVSNVLEAGSFARIEIERNVVLEPNETYEFPVTLKNISLTQAGGLSWEFDDADAKAVCVGNDDKAVITLKPSAAGTFQFKVSTVNEKKDEEGEDTGVPLASQTVTVKVRRVNAMDDLNPVITGAAATVGTTYEFVSHVTGDNLLVDLGAQYDDDYKNPNFVKFTAEISEQPAGKTVNDYIDVLAGYENQNSPMYKIKIKETIPAGTTVTIKATAKHPEGVLDGDGGFYNKASQDAKDAGEANPKRSYTSVVKEYNILGVDTPGSSYAINFPNGIKRGNDYVFGESITCSFKPDEIKNAFNKGGNTHFYMRYRIDDGTSEWSAYARSEESGATQKLNAAETKLFLPDKPYEIEIISVLAVGNKIYWPQDESLLAEKGFEGFEKGWTDEVFTNANTKDHVATSFEQYGGHYDLGVTEIVYYNNGSTNEDDAVDIPVGTYRPSVGTKGEPIVISMSGANEKPKRTTLYFEAKNLEKQHYHYRPIVWKDIDGQWVRMTTMKEVNGVMKEVADWKINLSPDKNNQFFTFEAIDQNKTAAEKAEIAGYYRIGFVLVGKYKTENGRNGNRQRILEDSIETEWDLFDTSNDNTASESQDGYVYLKYID